MGWHFCILLCTECIAISHQGIPIIAQWLRYNALSLVYGRISQGTANSSDRANASTTDDPCQHALPMIPKHEKVL